MTFDDGPQVNEPAFVSLLDDADAKATFFVNGYNWGCIYDEANVRNLRATYARGHEIASHTWDHPHSGNLTYEQFDDQIAFLETALIKILGIKPALYRPPYGEYSQSNIDVLTARNYSALVLWDDVAGPATGTSVQASNSMYQSRAAAYPEPHIVLNHEQDTTSLQQVIPAAISTIQRHGYRLVTAAQCLGVQPYQWIGEPSERDATWTCQGRPGPGDP